MIAVDLAQYLAKPGETLAKHTELTEENAEYLYRLGYIDEKIYDLLNTACHFHDYGKVNPAFQQRVRSNGAHFDSEKEVGHNILSLYFFHKDDFNEDNDYFVVANAVLNHHHYCSNFNVLYEKKELMKKLLADFGIYEVPAFMVKKLREIRNDRTAIIVQGLLHKCDYAASAHLPIEYENDFLSNCLNQLMEKWQKQDSKADWNELQQFCRAHSDKNIVVTAPTGMGKTEAALWWLGDHKGFYVLPLKTAINAIYDRIDRDILEGERSEERLALLHSDSIGYLLKQQERSQGSDWKIMDYKINSKRFSLPLSVSTPDQLFDFVFKYPGYELKLATLSYSRVIIDEIQSYSADLLAYIICGLEQINDVGGRFAVLTATLPPFIRDLLKGNTGRLNFEEPVNRPMDFEEAAFLNDAKRHHLKVLDEELTASGVAEVFTQNQKKSKSNKTLVVCNTIKKAQSIYNELKEMGFENTYLLHSKFTKRDRAQKEAKILADGQTFNADGSLHQGALIWVTTQIVEASLDIDFDYLLTELSDLNSLLQRLGRCNRKGVKSIADVNCWVFLQINQNLLTGNKGQGGFIDCGLHELSKEALLGFCGVLTEQKKLELMEQYLTTENLSIRGSSILDDFLGHYQYIKDLNIEENDGKGVAQRFRNIISYDVIPKKIYKENQSYILEKIRQLQDAPNYPERIMLQNEIKQFTVSVGYFDLGGSNKCAVCRELAENGRIALNRFAEIYIVECHYNSDSGFIRASKKGLAAQKKESDLGCDSFM